MPTIQDSPWPLAFAVAQLPATMRAASCHGAPQAHSLRTTARTLEGMQKEAVVSRAGHDRAWRLVCDEGPYLKGTDLAPFPLGHFCAGMVSCYAAELLRLLRERGISFSRFKLVQENRYAMNGSALAGTMTGSALPVSLQLVLDSPRKASELQALLQEAVTKAPVAALLNGVCVNEFSLTHNGERLSTERVVSTIDTVPAAPAGFDSLEPLADDLAQQAAASAPVPELIKKLRSATLQEGVPGGVASSLQDNQKRILHMRGSCELREDGLLETSVDLFQPLGSSFRFIADPEGRRAPDGLVYLSAGIAFCFLTQVGRYCSIRKWPLQDCTLVQDSCFHPAQPGQSPRMQPVVTHMFLQAELDSASAQQVLDMSEQTCFLHAACRQPVPVELQDFCRAIPLIP